MTLNRTAIASSIAWCLGSAFAIASSDQVEVLEVRGAVVVAGHPEAARLGMEVLNAGGNAADALVTVSTSLGVVEPGNSGLGGKLILLYYNASDRSVTCIAALGAAPMGIDRTQISATPAPQRRRGALAACTPGLLAGLDEVHRRFGTMPWAELIEPVERLARDGFELSQHAAEMMGEFPPEVDADAARLYNPSGKAPAAGERLSNPDLADTLSRIARLGAAEFYTGETARRLAAGVQAKGGWISEGDLASYRVRVVEPVSVEVGGSAYFSSPPPLTGGSILLASYAALAEHDWEGAVPRDAAYIDAVGRVVQQVYRETSARIGDTDDAPRLARELLSPGSIRAIRDRARDADVAKPYAHLESFHDDLTQDDAEYASTTHLVIVDAAGNVACATQSLGNHFGSGVVPAGTGVLLNNDINNFAFRGDTSPNLIAPGKWPRSTMAPTLVLRDGAVELAIGSPAGQRIPIVLLQNLIDVRLLGRNVGESIAAPRFHIRRGTSATDGANQVDLEDGSDPELAKVLAEKGWRAAVLRSTDYYFGAVNAVQLHADGTRTAVADRRRTSDAAAN